MSHSSRSHGLSTQGLPILQCLLELAQTHVRYVGDTIRPPHPHLTCIRPERISLGLPGNGIIFLLSTPLFRTVFISYKMSTSTLTYQERSLVLFPTSFNLCENAGIHLESWLSSFHHTPFVLNVSLSHYLNVSNVSLLDTSPHRLIVCL